MKPEVCKPCPHLSYNECRHHGKLISRIRGCSLSPSGKVFMRAKSGAEAYRVNVLGKKGAKDK